MAGIWYVPNLEVQHEGYITIKKNRLYLILHTANTFEGQPLSDSFNVVHNNYPIIVGNSRHGKCTLYKCRWAGCEPIGKEMHKLKYEVQFVFLNAVVENENDLLVKSADFQFSNLSSWYDGYKSMSRVSPYTGTFIGDREMRPDTRNSQKIVKVTDNINFVFIDSFPQRLEPGGNEIALTFQKYLRIEFVNPVSFDTLISEAIYFSELLSTCFFSQASFSLLATTFIDKVYSHFGKDIYNRVESSMTYNYSINHGKPITDNLLSSNSMLISRWKFEETEMNNIIRKWFENRKYSKVYDYFIDSHKWSINSWYYVSDVMFNNRFLNMVQGIEGYYNLSCNVAIDNNSFNSKKQEIIDAIKPNNPELAIWADDIIKPPTLNLKKKLEHLLEQFKPQISLRFGNHIVMKNFILKAVKYRNHLSHSVHKETYQGEELSTLFLAIQYLLALCILKSLNVDNFEKTMKENIKLNDAANEIVAYVNKNHAKYSQ